MNQVRAANENDESGAALVLALIFIVVLGVVISVLTTLSGTNLTDMVQLQGQREAQYAAGGAVDAEIQAIRKLNNSLGGLNGGTSTQACQSFPTTGSLAVTQDVNQISVVATCSAFPGSHVQSLQITNSSPQLTVPVGGTYKFSAADVGQMVLAFGVPANTIILSVQPGGTTATMSRSAGTGACTLSTCTQSVTLQTPPGQREVLLQGCLGNSCTGTPVVKAVVRYYDQATNGSPSPGVGVIVQSWVVQAANA